MSDPQKYRTKDEVAEFQDKDPINYVLDVIKKKRYLKADEIEAIQAEVKDLVEESVKFAEESPDPQPHELYEDVYMQTDYPYVND
jgi:pyruvate dehydrogenase E1 component alpha subunit